MGYYSETLKKGSQGEETKKWQNFLKSQGYDLDVDGIFGDITSKYTTDWQQKNGLEADGIVGSLTWGKAGFSDLHTPVSAPTSEPLPTKPTYDDTSYDDTEKGKATLGAYNTAKDAVEGYGDFTYGNQQQFDEIMDKILNREKFSYNLNGDALYQQYKDKYIKQGKMAMGDAIGQASAMTGGYGNSYAQSVGQQAYQAQLDNLNDIVPELYQMALDKYNMEGQDLYNQYGMLSDDRTRAYGEWKDGYDMLMDKLGIARGDYYDGADMHYTEQNNKNTVAGMEFDDAMDIWNANNTESWNQAEWDESGRQREEDIAHRDEREKVEDDQWQTERTESNAKTFYETGGKVGYDNGSVSTENIKIMQEALGVSTDGKWGAGSKEASGGLTADQAWKAYQDGKLGKSDTSYNDIADDCDLLISRGAEKSEINNYLHEALQNGYITQEEYNKLKETYAPKGNTYSTNIRGGSGYNVQMTK